MPVNKYTIILLLLLACGSCIDPFEPEISESQDVLVISGVITDQAGPHQVTVSRSSPYSDPARIPVSGFVIAVEDELGNMRHYIENGPGLYIVYLDDSFLEVGKSYSLIAVSPSGSEYRSEYDTLLACPQVDSVYYEVKSQGTADPEVSYYGLQFYNDLEGMPGGAKNFRWALEETWEYTSPFSADVIFEEQGYSQYGGYAITICYKTDRINDLFTASTRALAENRLNRNSLNYVSNQSPRLSFKYSLLVQQQSLSNEAFEYWDQLRTSISEGGGLYETQPSSTVGNVFNASHPEEKVLGCFYATQVREKRITVDNDFNFSVERFRCYLDTVFNFSDIGSLYPYYGISLAPLSPSPPWLFGPTRCFDCRDYGGVTEKPDYW